ncbi:MAG: TonB-dependent receptor, partial [Pseudomonadota bacterium]
MRIFSDLSSRSLLTVMVSATLGLFVSGVASAQTDGQPFLEEIVVTAAKREQTLQEVPIAVSVTDADTIQKSQILDILDLQTVVPSLRITQLQSSANTNFIIRGFGNGANNPGIEPSVGVFIDGVYRSRSAGALSDLPNLQRVEVLRGPQSTLFGKNASAGVISVVTQEPQFEFGGSAELVIGNYGQVVAKGDITGPLSDNVAFSLSASSNQRDGYFENVIDGTNTNERSRYGMRGQLLFEPSEAFSLRIIADYDEIDEDCCGTGNLFDGPTGNAVRALGGQIASNDPFAYDAFINFPSTNEIENSGISAQADFTFGNYDLTSITSFRNQSAITDADSDFTSADILGRNAADQDIDTITQELRLTTSFGDNVDFLVGLFYFDEEVQFDTDIQFGADFRGFADLLAGGPGAVTGLEPVFGIPTGTFFADGAGAQEFTGQDDTAISLFTSVDWYVSDRATLTLGLNYTQVEKDAFIRQNNSDVFSSLDFVSIGIGGAFTAITGLDPTPMNFAAQPAAFAAAQTVGSTPCTPATAPNCNQLLALQPFQFLPPFVEFPNSVESGNSDDSETSYTVRFAYDLNDSLNVYVSAATGFKATSWNLSRDSRPFASDLAALTAAGLNTPNLTTGTRFAGPEESTAYEIGLKGKFSRGAFNLAIFDQSIEGFQSNTFSGTGFNLTNAGEQSTFGLEFDGNYFFTDNFQGTFAMTYLDPTYDEFLFSVNGDISGTTPPGIHELSATVTGTYTWDLANGSTIFLRGEYVYEDEIAIVDNVPPTIVVPGVPTDLATREVGLLNMSAGWQSVSGWDLSVW